MALSPYNLDDDQQYQLWRRQKLEVFTAADGVAMVDIEDPYELSEDEKKTILNECDQNNCVIYQLVNKELSDKSLVHELGRQLGLERLDSNLRADEDSVSSIEVAEQSGNQYIPYTDRPISWHCDGYYNTLDYQVRGMVLHCVAPAESGGENQLIDHEILYIRLRDEDPALIQALMEPDVMTIPENIENGVELRAAQSGPVFSVDEAGNLHMRYSARKRNIRWKDNEITRRATEKITELLNDGSISHRHRLAAGQGIICNNVLHNRSSFEDSGTRKRLMYRARYYDRVKKPVNNE